ncbi:MAG TPA: hypothetical protein VFB37_00225 [Steroidobacteraceae bacterium]|nr:hypothetical protein [Steroidobacteraceae bacterium]
MTFASATPASRQNMLGDVVGSGWVTRCGTLLRQLGPYAAIELLLPGGSLIVLALWLYRRHRLGRREDAQSKMIARVACAILTAVTAPLSFRAVADAAVQCPPPRLAVQARAYTLA